MTTPSSSQAEAEPAVMMSTTPGSRMWVTVAVAALVATLILAATLIVFRLCVESLEVDDFSHYDPRHPPSLGYWYVGLQALVVGGVLAACGSIVVLSRLVTRSWNATARVVAALLVPLCLGGAVVYISAAARFHCDVARDYASGSFALFRSSGWDEIGLLPGVPIVWVNGCQGS